MQLSQMSKDLRNDIREMVWMTLSRFEIYSRCDLQSLFLACPSQSIVINGSIISRRLCLLITGPLNFIFYGALATYFNISSFGLELSTQLKDLNGFAFTIHIRWSNELPFVWLSQIKDMKSIGDICSQNTI